MCTAPPRQDEFLVLVAISIVLGYYTNVANEQDLSRQQSTLEGNSCTLSQRERYCFSLHFFHIPCLSAVLLLWLLTDVILLYCDL